MKTLLSLIIIPGLVYVSIIAVYAVAQRSLIYYPQKLSIEQARMQAAALGGTPWVSKDGSWLGWKASPLRDSKAVKPRRALVFHGNAGMALNRDYYVDLLSGFSASGPWDVYIHEYPGYGPRPGTPNEQTLVSAAVSAADQLITSNPEPLLIIGESLGSGVASALARERPDVVAALLLITPFDSMVNVANHHMPWLPARFLLRDRYENLQALAGFKQALLVITAGNDEIIPEVLSQPLLHQHSGRLLFKSQIGQGHNTLQFRPGQAPWPEVDQFLSALPLQP